MWLTERFRHSSVAKQVSSAGQRDVASEGLVPLCRHVGCKEARLANRGSQVCLQGPFKGCCHPSTDQKYLLEYVKVRTDPMPK